ncbi:MAG: ATP-binding protein, partial [Dietzia cercidiphylli]
MTTMPSLIPRHGHHRVVERLRELHDAVVDRGSSVVLVTAPYGAGKSHLVDTLLTGTTGVTTVLTRALPWEHDVRWVIADRILRRLPPVAPPGDGETPGPAGVERTGSRVVDELDAALGGAGAGTVIVIDDADHADPGSLRALGSALETSVDGAVLLVLTAGNPSEGPSADLCSTLAREILHLGALDHSEIRALAAARTGREPSAAAARRILDYTGGAADAVAAVVDEA